MFDAIMRTSAANANRQFEALESISLNVANINTPAYKAKRFEQYLTSDDRLEGSTRVDTSQGDRMITRRELDTAVQGRGYIPVTQPDGTVAYTRDGSMTLNNQGYLVTQRGDMIGDGIKIPVNYQKIQIREDGTVKVQTPDQTLMHTIGKISLVRFTNPEKLTNLGGNKAIPSSGSGEPIQDSDSKLYQGMVEQANVDVYGQVEQLLRISAATISNIRVIKFSDDLFRQSVNLKQ